MAANAKNAKKKPQAAEAPRRMHPVRMWFTIIMVLITAAIFLPTTIIFTVSLLPTVVAAIVDSHPRKTAWITVGVLNFAGAVPVWLRLMDMGNHISDAFSLIVQPVQILMPYGAAAIGWAFYNKVPPLVAAMLVARAERRVKEIGARQAELVRKWGEEVVLK